MKTSFQFWTNYLKIISIIFTAMGVMWVIIGSFDPFGIYDQAYAQAFWGADKLPVDAKKATQFLLVPLGATNSGFFILQYFITKYAYAERQLWGYRAIMAGFFFWFFLDTGMCLYYKAYFNILIANVPSLVAMLPIIFTRKYFN